MAHAFRQPFVAGGEFCQQGGVVHVQRKIVHPEVPIGLRRALQNQGVALHPGGDGSVFHNALPAVRTGLPSEGLAAVQGGGQIHAAAVFHNDQSVSSPWVKILRLSAAFW